MGGEFGGERAVGSRREFFRSTVRGVAGLALAPVLLGARPLPPPRAGPGDEDRRDRVGPDRRGGRPPVGARRTSDPLLLAPSRGARRTRQPGRAGSACGVPRGGRGVRGRGLCRRSLRRPSPDWPGPRTRHAGQGRDRLRQPLSGAGRPDGGRGARHGRRTRIRRLPSRRAPGPGLQCDQLPLGRERGAPGRGEGRDPDCRRRCGGRARRRVSRDGCGLRSGRRGAARPARAHSIRARLST